MFNLNNLCNEFFVTDIESKVMSDYLIVPDRLRWPIDKRRRSLFPCWRICIDIDLLLPYREQSLAVIVEMNDLSRNSF